MVLSDTWVTQTSVGECSRAAILLQSWSSSLSGRYLCLLSVAGSVNIADVLCGCLRLGTLGVHVKACDATAVASAFIPFLC